MQKINSENHNAPIFLFGFPRSGTTLLYSILKAHPEISIFLEPEFYSVKQSLNNSLGDNFTLAQLKRELENTNAPLLRFLHPIEHELETKFSWKSLFVKLFYTSSFFGTKSLNSGFYLEEILKDFPQAKLIMIVRDPRATIFSNIRKKNIHSQFDDHFTLFMNQALKWKFWHKHIVDSRYFDRIFIIRYEDLVESPKQNLKILGEYIGVQNLSTYNTQESRKAAYTGLPDFAKSSHESLFLDITNNNSRYREQLSDWLIQIIESLVFPLASKFSYGSRLNKLPIAKRLAPTYLKHKLYHERRIRQFIKRRIMPA